MRRVLDLCVDAWPRCSWKTAVRVIDRAVAPEWRSVSVRTPSRMVTSELPICARASLRPGLRVDEGSPRRRLESRPQALPISCPRGRAADRPGANG